MAGRLGIDQTCIFTGHRADVHHLLAAMDVFALPSLSEGIPMALLEAMSLGVPVVATRVGGIPEVIRDRVTGLLVPAGDDRALAEACLQLARYPDWAAEIGAAGRVVRVRGIHAGTRRPRARRHIASSVPRPVLASPAHVHRHGRRARRRLSAACDFTRASSASACGSSVAIPRSSRGRSGRRVAS